ncbi:MAG: hypothetical protein CM15mV73_130 [Caudoviricetes sp.]|nr:MAG: hypothetical protein CM15mV73_130 [Caudoviricetes sp.]
MEEEKPKAGRIEFDVKRQLWIVFNGEEWVEVDLKNIKCAISIIEYEQILNIEY